jgi:LmbE family N-acetylglucosaminyl deacetylase
MLTVKKTFFILTGTFLILFNSAAQRNVNYNAAAIRESIRKLNVLGSVLYIAAHPDDENTRLITFFTKEKLYNTAYLSLTRGDGGQNLIGTELNDLLGVIRTQELLEARRIDGGKQFFSRARDFGFSKNPDETFRVWDREQTLADMVWLIRKFQPDVLITRFNTEPGRTHGHHTASAILAGEAFTAAADPGRFPEQLQYVKVWQAKRLLWNTTSWFYQKPEDFKPEVKIKIDVGTYNKATGKSYTEIASCSRSQHKSQGFGSSGTRGTSIEYLEHTMGPQAQNDIFEDIDASWARIEGGKKIGQDIEKLLKTFRTEDPAGAVPELLKIRKAISALPESVWKKTKLEETDEIIKACLGLWTEALAEDFSVVPGEQLKINSEVINRSAFNVELKKVSFGELKDTVFNSILKDNTPVTTSTRVTIPAGASYSHPYWLRERGTTGMFKVTDQLLIGLPENPPALSAEYSFMIGGQEIVYNVPVVFKKTDPVKGEQYRPLEIAPSVFINLKEDKIVFADNSRKTIAYNIKAGKDKCSGRLKFTAPSGWIAEPSEIPFSIAAKGGEYNCVVSVKPGEHPAPGTLKAVAELNDKTSDKSLITIAYDHILTQTLFPLADVDLINIDLKKAGEKIGYIQGAGDEVPSALEQVGYNVTILKEETVTPESLKKFDAVVIGIRAFNANEKLRKIHAHLLDYVKNGGTLVAQYNTMPGRITATKYVTDSIGPYPFKISNDRVTDENAEIRILNPDHVLLNYPNKITDADFRGWIQERGLYFPDSWSKEYETVIATNDPGEASKEGSILYTKYGKGVFIYTTLSWFRELPAGVPGAYRLFVNLISANKN